MQHYAAFHLGLHCWPKYLFRGFQYKKGFCELSELFGCLHFMHFWFPVNPVMQFQINIEVMHGFYALTFAGSRGK